MKATAAIARFSLLEAWRTRVAWLVLGALAAAWLAAEFAASLALTASASYRSTVYAGLVRLLLVFILMLFVTNGVAREFAERLHDLYWSRPLSRSAWFVGRLLGAALLALAGAALACLPLLAMAPLPAVAAWGLTFAAELVIVAVASLTAIVALTQVMPALLATTAFYLLSRAMSAIVLMSAGPAVDPESWSTHFIARVVDTIALALPALDRYARSEWLHAVGDGQPPLVPVLLEAAVYVVLLAAVGLFDLQRRED